jgi:uncharacterized protein YbaP (TraB family)
MGILCAFAWLLGALAAPPGLWAQEKSFLWKVGSDKGAIHILGSIHFLKKEHYPLKKTIDQAFAASQKVVLEIDLQSATPEKAQRAALEKGILRDGTTLKQIVSSETYGLAERRSGELGVDFRAMGPMKPWLVALTLTALKLQKLGFDANYGVDRQLAERAKNNGKPTGGLETLEFQIGLFDQLSRRDQELMLRETLRELDLLDMGVERIVQAWVSGDVGGVEELLLAGMREYPEVHQKIIVDRNRRWLPEIERIIERGESALVVVGAAHLVGKDGVIELLKQRGYKVEQL